MYSDPIKGIGWSPDWEGHRDSPGTLEHAAQVQLLVLKELQRQDREVDHGKRIQEGLNLVRRFVDTPYEAAAIAYLAAQVEIAKREQGRSRKPAYRSCSCSMPA